jgi:hypothetical protein
MNDTQTRELIEAELDAVSGGVLVSSYQGGGPHEATAAAVDAFSSHMADGGGAGKLLVVIA